MRVKVTGLRELDRALGKVDRDLRTGLRARLKSAADIIAREARALAAQRTTRRTGDLLRGIKPYALSGRAGVRSSAVHGGFQYPRRLEFEGRTSQEVGPRASLIPAGEARRDEVNRAVEQMVDGIADEFNTRRP